MDDSHNQNRRSFLRRVSAATLGLSALTRFAHANKEQRPSTPSADDSSAKEVDRINRAYQLRQQNAGKDRDIPVATPRQIDRQGNDEEKNLPNYIGSYCKALPHDDLGQVNNLAYRTYLNALASGKPSDLEAIPMGAYFLLSNPRAAYSYNLDACDSCQIPIATAPSFASAEAAAEMIELYWMALLRDVPFSEYGRTEDISKAVEDLGRRITGYAGPRNEDGALSASTLFRERTVKGSMAGSYISQFLWLDVPYGPTTIVQKYRFPVGQQHYLTHYSDWLRIQRGFPPDDSLHLDATRRYIRTGRDLAEYVHRDFTYQAFLNAALISFGAAYSKHEPRVPFARGNPYVDSLTQTGFSTFGGPNVLEMMPRAASVALRASWYQKWLVFRKLRPEEFGGRVQNHLAKKAQYPIHKDVFASSVLEKTYGINKSWLLPQAYPEAAPNHPSFPAGHAVIAGACATVIKAFFDEDYELPNAMQPTADGSSLEPYRGETKLTLGAEIDKLAVNIGMGRSFAGIHWRSDTREGLKVGEAAATSVLRNWKNSIPEGSETQMSFSSLAGEKITI